MIFRSLLVCIFALTTSFLSADPPYQDVSKLKIFIKMDKRTFYSDESVIVKVFVRNISSENVFYYVYSSLKTIPSDNTTFQPVVIDSKGREAAYITNHRRANIPIADILTKLNKRLVELAPGDSNLYEIPLTQIFELQLNSSYRLVLNFFPDISKTDVIRSSNVINFKIIQERRLTHGFPSDTINRKLSPKEIIRLMLSSEKEHDWENYIKFINIEKFINVYPQFIQQFANNDFQEKQTIIKSFINYLLTTRPDSIINFQIINEEYSDQNAFVDVNIERFGIKKTNRYRYRFTLEKNDSIWLVTDLEVSMLKGIKR